MGKLTGKIVSSLISALLVISSLPLLNTGTVNAATTGITLSGTCHVQDYGDTAGSWDAATGILTLGTRGQSKRVEAITINLENTTGYSGTLQYRVHVQDIGWQDYRSAGEMAGTAGQSKRLEGIEMYLTGELAQYYTVEYAVHIQDYGDAQGFVSDGALAGTTGESKRLEEVQVRIVPRGTGSSMSVNYRVHRQDYGWESTWVKDGAESGTTGQSKRLEGIEIHLTGNQYSGSIIYHTHVQNIGWESDWSKDGEMSGTQGMSYRLEGIEIKLTGQIADYYDVYYRVHAQDYGWLGWAKNGQMSGTSGMSKRLEAIQIVLVAKNGAAPGNVAGVSSIMTEPAVIDGVPTIPEIPASENPSSSPSSTPSSQPSSGTGTTTTTTTTTTETDGYTYEITPMLSPFNDYFYVKTNNANGNAFRFKDNSSKYSTDSYIELDSTYYADVVYENTSTYRVKDGFIFYSGTTDGGDVVLQVLSGSTWTDTSLVFTLPTLVDNADYLVQTYTDSSKGYFDNMSAVQSGFDSICLYGGPSIRGALKKNDNSYWGIYTSPHVDQSFYIGSPYSYGSSTPMLTTRLYPFRYDSLGFPGMMISVSKIICEKYGYSGVTYKWSDSSHAFVQFTYNGTTNTYGGAGNGKGHAILESDINGYFKFDNSSTDMNGISLSSLYSKIWDYMAMPEPDAGYNTKEFTWNDVFDDVGKGSWIKVYCAVSVFGGGFDGYTYIGQSVSKPGYHSFGYAPGTGGSLTTSPYDYLTDMTYFSNCWVDGRYINTHEFWQVGATFADYPTATIVLIDPVIKVPSGYFTANSWYDSSKYNSTTGQWTGAMRFFYNSTEDCWISEIYDSRYSTDSEFVDACYLTQDEVAAMGVDSNTNTAPASYYNYDRSEEPGKYYTT